MAFIDELTIHIAAGKGGDGVVRWRHAPGNEFAGPSGGDGGRGGHVYIRAVRDVHLLGKYKTKKEFRAENGGDGMRDSLHGANGEDLIIDLPVGSLVTNTFSKEVFSLVEEGETVQILKGGQGGRGNESYKSSVNRSPEQHTDGKPGEENDFHIEVELIADIGLIGLPNAGKSSLLNELSRAGARVGDYPSTTLEPNLGEMHGYILADIPGLIEGAGDGKGLGHKFLRHVRRTKMLAHLVSFEEADPVHTYMTVRNELERFDPDLMHKKEIIVLTKTDVADEETRNAVVQKMQKFSSLVTSVSIYDDASLKSIRERFIKELSDV